METKIAIAMVGLVVLIGYSIIMTFIYGILLTSNNERETKNGRT